MKKTIDVSESLIKKVQKLADKDKRSWMRQVEVLLEESIKQQK